MGVWRLKAVSDRPHVEFDQMNKAKREGGMPIATQRIVTQ
jgi:hypothetical protein